MLHELKEMIGKTGKVIDVYGGYEITIDQIEKFPWHKVCMLLLDYSFEVWMVRSNSKLIIMSKPATE